MSRLHCPDCRGAELELHQPDEQSPARVLGICPHCRGWIAMAKRAGKWEAVATAFRREPKTALAATT